MSYPVVVFSALVCELHGCTCSLHGYKDICNLHGHEGHSNVTEAGSIPADGQGGHAPVEPLLGSVSVLHGWMQNRAAVRASSCLAPPQSETQNAFAMVTQGSDIISTPVTTITSVRWVSYLHTFTYSHAGVLQHLATSRRCSLHQAPPYS